jgi:hypothetical protein
MESVLVRFYLTKIKSLMKGLFALVILLVQQVNCENFTEEMSFEWNET